MRHRPTAVNLSTSLAFSLALFATGSASAQQFDEQTSTRFPTATNQYTNQLTVGDVDGDDDLDIIWANGGGFSSPAALPSRSRLYINNGSGVFTDETTGNLGFSGYARGVELGDIDGDGDLDVLVTAGGGPLRLFRNDMPKKGRWLVVHAVDPALNRVALGAVVRVSAGGRSLQRRVLAGFSYASSSQPIAHFGLGDVDRIDDVTIRWPDGTRERFTGITVDSAVTLSRGAGLALPR